MHARTSIHYGLCVCVCIVCVSMCARLSVVCAPFAAAAAAQVEVPAVDYSTSTHQAVALVVFPDGAHAERFRV